MSAKRYNILWADDEIASLLENDEVKRRLLAKHINVLDENITTSEELKIALNRYKDLVDAVIVDANFCRDSHEVLTDETLSGLFHSAMLAEYFNRERYIPFYIYSARKNKLATLCKNREIDYFESKGRIYQKGEIEEITDAIVKDIDDIHTATFWVNKRYGAIIQRIKSIDGTAANHLQNFLLQEAYDIEFTHQVDMFNHLRQILEVIQLQCHQKNIVPRKVKGLNSFVFFWDNKHDRGYEEKGANGMLLMSWKPKRNDIMPKFLSQSLKIMVQILQDGSHHLEDDEERQFEPLKINEHVSKFETPFLFRYCLHYVLELLLWFEDLVSKLETSEEFKTPLYKSERPRRY